MPLYSLHAHVCIGTRKQQMWCCRDMHCVHHSQKQLYPALLFQLHTKIRHKTGASHHHMLIIGAVCFPKDAVRHVL